MLSDELIIQGKMSHNRDAVVNPWSGYSRETSGTIFSSRSALQIGVYTG